MASPDPPSPEPEERGPRPVTVLVALGVALVVLLAASAFLPRWWSHRIGNQADGSFTNGIGLGLFYGFAFTLLALVLLVVGLRTDPRAGRVAWSSSGSRSSSPRRT